MNNYWFRVVIGLCVLIGGMLALIELTWMYLRKHIKIGF